MENIAFIEPKEQYIREYWDVFREIIDERIYLGVLEPFPLDDTVEFIKECIKNNVPQLFAMDKSEGRIIGWCDVQPKDKVTGNLGIGILNEYREFGIGKKLIMRILEMCKEYGYKKVELDVRKDNERAIHVYEEMGFKLIKINKDGLELNGVKEDIIEMSLELK